MTVRQASFSAGVAGVLGLFLAACLFAHPTADDFIYASNARAGLWSAWIQEYLAWNGRYTSNALLLATPLNFGLNAYRLAAVAMLVGTAAAVSAFVRVWAGSATTVGEALGCGLTFCALFLSQMPSLGEGFYWYTSAATYQAWVVPALLYLALVVRYGRLECPSIRDRIGLVGAAALVVAAAGFNEVVMLMMLALHGVWLAWTLRLQVGGRARAGAFLLVIVLSACAVLGAPGNAVRQSMYSAVRHRLGSSLVWTAMQTLRFGADWISSGALLLATVLFIPIADQWAYAWRQDVRAARRWLVALVAGMVLIVPLTTFPVYWETGTLGQHRTVDAAYFAFLLMWFAAVPMSLAVGRERTRTLRAFSAEWRRPVAVGLLAALALTRNGYAVGSDLASGRFTRFDRAMRDRYAALQECGRAGPKTCDIRSLDEVPASFVILDVSPVEGDWVNLAYARYFGLTAVRAAPSEAGEHVRD